MLLFPRVGPHTIVACLIEAGTARHYRTVMSRHPVTRDLLRAAVRESGNGDPGLRAALDVAATELREAGWATRCAKALWSGTFPTELDLTNGMTGFVFRSAAAQAATDANRQGLIRAVASKPEFGAPEFVGAAGSLALSVACTHPDQYRAALAGEPATQALLAEAVRQCFPLGDAATEYVVGLRDTK